MCKTNTRKRIAFLVAVLLAVAIFAILVTPVEAAGTPTKIVAFTDKKVYQAWWMNRVATGAPTFNALESGLTNEVEPTVYVYATVLDDDGNIMKGRTIQVTLNDTVFDHYEKNDWTRHSDMVANNTYFISTKNLNDSGASGDAVNGDGLYTTVVNMPSQLMTDVQSNPRMDDHVRVKVFVRDTATGLNATTYILISWGRCHQTAAQPHPHLSKGTSDLCTACHGGYEHFFEGVSNTIPYESLDIHYKVLGDSLPDSTDSKSGMDEYNWNSTRKDSLAPYGVNLSWKLRSGGGAVYCLFCHKDPADSQNLLDYGDNNRGTTADRPSCSQSSSGYGGLSCHSTTEIEATNVIPWSQGGAAPVQNSNDTLININRQKSHNKTGIIANVTCTLCHAGPHGLSLPNTSVDISSSGNINDQCRTCHNVTGGLNITANGGTNVAHDGKTNCKNCHVDNNKLNSHLVPTGVFGGKWCLDCHNLTGKAPINMKVDPLIVNISNKNYTHYKLNNNSDASNSSKICWGCHTNNSYVFNRRVNASNLSATDHPTGYDTPRNCTACHYNTSVYNFSAPQNARHTWYAPNMNTTAVTSCSDCHARDEMLNVWNETVYPPKNDSESASHYGKNRTSFFLNLITTGKYCQYCHQNESTVMGPFANPDNEVRSDHASQITTPSCGNNTCHKDGRLHDDTLVVPTYNESNINTTCLSCHSNTSYNAHNSTLTCWDCHMGNVSNTSSTWIHPIQFIQYNGNFTGAKLTSATCYDCHKSTSVDNTTQNLSGKKAPKVYNQAHSNDPTNGTKWGDYWKYTPTTYQFASYNISGGNGSIDPSHPFENIMVPSNEYMQLNETKIGSGNGSTVPFNEKEREINGPPVPNWTSSTAMSGNTAGSVIKAEQDSTKGNPAGSLKASFTTGSGSGTIYGYVWWNYSFYYNPNSSYGYAFTNASADYNITSDGTYTQTVYLRLVKPSGATVTLASTSSASNTGWLNLTNNSFASVFTEDGSVTPYRLQLYTELSGVKTSKTYTVNYDNILLKFQEKVRNRYELVVNTTGVPVSGNRSLGMSYQVHRENTSLMIYNNTSKAYELVDTLDKGVFFDYVKNINSTHYINSANGITGNVSVKFVDTDQSDVDTVSDAMHIRYLYVYTDRGLQYPCEQCHSPNKHYINPAIGSPDKFKGNNKYNTTDMQNSTWCQQCHWQGASNYSDMVKEYNVTRNPPENIPPEITGNATYAPLGKPGYVNHTGSAYSNMNDSGCFGCHGKSGDTTTSQFVHNVQVGASGSRQCITCHNTSASNTQYKKVDVDALRKGMHANLKNASANVSNASNPIELACWACHGDGLYNNSDDHHPGIKTCDKCHTNTTGKLNYSNATKVYEHIRPGFITPEANITANSTASWSCADCHNNSINTTALINDNEADPINARTGHYGLNRTSGKLMYDYSTPPKGNSEDCNYCHKGNNANMTKWGVNTSSVKNLSNKLSPTDHTTFVNNDCAGCHNYTSTSSFTFHVAEINEGAGASGPNCTNCHDIGKSATGKLVNVTAMNDTNAIHKNLNKGASTTDNGYNGSKSCWACHDEGSQPSGHNPSRYKNPYNCTDCHNASGSQSGKYPGWNVTEHVKAGTVSGTELFTPLAGNCYACHNKTEMMITAYDPDSGTGAVYGGANGGNNSTSHYGIKRPNLGGFAPNTDGYCNYCHKNASSIFYLSSSNKSILEHTANTSANISNATTLECIDCHATGRIHNNTLAKPSTQVWTSGKQDYCAPCHKAGNASATKYVYGHNSSNISVLTTDCGYCHNASSQGQVSAGALRIHTPSLTNKSTANTTCTSCHQDAAYVTNQRVVYTHYPGAPSGKANTSQDSFTCESCHGNMAANKMHAPVSIPADRCNNCHNGTASGTYKATKIPYVNATKHDNTSHNGANVNCEWCHNNSNAIQKFHFTQYPNGTAQAPGWAGWVNGTNANCTNCHDTYKDASPFYAEPIWHKGNYGTTPDNCYQCHTNVSSAASGFAPIALHNVTKAIDWSYCNNCHSNNYGGAPIVDNASLASSMHYNLNGSTPSTTERACKACHGGNSTLHKNTTVNNCTYCHVAPLNYTTKNVSRHIPYPYTTDVNTSRYQNVFCSDCHNNSLGTFNDPTQSNKNATTSHYGMNKTGGKLMYNNTGNTEDCVYCHRNDSNMAAWGILGTSNANLSKKGGSHATAANSNCYTCHVNSTSAPTTFHVEDVSAGTGGGPDCIACHNIGGMAQGKLVNFSVMNDTGAIHKNLNSGASASGVDVENKKCWACHTTNGTAPQAGNHSFVDRYKNPYNCTDCHISKAGQNFNYTPINTLLNVTQHKADTQNGTTIFTPSAGDCYSCHNSSEMMVAANDPDSGTGVVYGGLHGGNDSVSHYGLKRNLGSGDAYCNYCHNNASSMFPFANQHSKSIFEHTANGTADIRNTTTLECLDCHTSDLQSYRIHNSTLKTPTTSVWTSGKQDRCAPCHKAVGSGSSLKVNNSYHNTTTGSITDCGYCHNNDAMRAGNAPQSIHSDNLTAGGNSTYNNCYNCHQNGFASKVIIEHTNNTGANITNASMTCAKGGCHISNKTHSAALVKPVINNWTTGGGDYCAPCHNSSDSANNATKKVYNQGHNPTNRTNDNITSCGNCHNASTPGGIPASFRLHDSSLTNLSGSSDSTCQGCHNGTSLFVGAGRQIFSHMPNASQYRGNTTTSSYTCEYCHNMSGKPSMHSAGMNRSNGTCETCHLNNTSPFKSTQKNITQLAGGMLNHSYNGSANTTCKMCHNASGRQKFHLAKYASGDIADPQYPNGTSSFSGYDTWPSGDSNNRGILVDCRDCHEKYNDTAPFNAPYFEANKTGVNNQEHVGKNYKLQNCYVCHTSKDSADKAYTVHNVSIEPLSGGPNCTKCHDIGATDPSKAPPNMLVNFTAFNNSAAKHRNLTNATAWGSSTVFGLIDTACWACHQSDGKQMERHPDLKDNTSLTGGSKAYRCADCHAIGGNVSAMQPSIYNNAKKVYKHYPGAVFSGNKIFTNAVNCSVCHKNSKVVDINISAYSDNIDAMATNISHYATRIDLIDTRDNVDSKGCDQCHAVGGIGGTSGSNYGNAIEIPINHNSMGGSPARCQKSCHNSNPSASVNITLHASEMGINIGTAACFSSGCHTPPNTGGRRRK